MRTDLIKLLIITIITSFMCEYAFADIYVTYNTKTDEVIDMSKHKDVVLDEDGVRAKLPGKLTDYDLQYHPSYYKYKDNKFIVNIKKISDDAIAKDKCKARQLEMKKIEKQVYLNAKKELEANGEVFKEIKDKDFK